MSRSSGCRSPSTKKGIVHRSLLVKLQPRMEIEGELDDAVQLGCKVPQSVLDRWHVIEDRDKNESSLSPLSDEDGLFVKRTLDFAAKEAQICQQTQPPESQWISKVAMPMLNLFEHTALGSASLEERGKSTSSDSVAAFDIRTTEISSDYVPTSTYPTLRDLDRKIDVALGLRLSRRTLRRLQDEHTSINQTASFVNFTPLFLNIEVKRNYGAQDPLIQLGVWTAAEFEKRWAEKWDMGMPALAVEIDGPLWNLYVVAAKEKESDTVLDFELSIVGPVELGSSRDRRSLQNLFDNLCVVVQWARTEYLGWFERCVVEHRVY
ncbi:hypothetical protein EJ04DRAFT_510578 [Polyplosphaeria fusca]|uniref:PD-(D/E)XK nuclease-like domain-containing protein n=1 Tax=Polyplosphaeria fusca TaxID=682080 RepID=A0A9P4R5U2_9PLEO|nr:hypothetical protein EJ04DRAFT_510578 [Polyplosphaeria fusca]